MFKSLLNGQTTLESIEERLEGTVSPSILKGLETVRLLFPVIQETGELYIINEGDSPCLMLLESAKTETEFGFVATLATPGESETETPACFSKNAARATAEFWMEDPTRVAVVKREDNFVHVVAQAGDKEWTRRPVRPGVIQELQKLTEDEKDSQVSVFIAPPAQKQLALKE